MYRYVGRYTVYLASDRRTSPCDGTTWCSPWLRLYLVLYVKLSCRLIEARSVSRDLFSECRGYRESSEAAPQGRQTAHRRRRLLRAACLDSSLEKDRHGMRQTRAMLPA